MPLTTFVCGNYTTTKCWAPLNLKVKLCGDIVDFRSWACRTSRWAGKEAGWLGECWSERRGGPSRQRHSAADFRQLGPGGWQGNAVRGQPCSMQEQLQAQALIVCHNLPPRHSQLLAQPCMCGGLPASGTNLTVCHSARYLLVCHSSCHPRLSG